MSCLSFFYWVNSSSRFILQRICIPPPVIGGLLFAILVAVLDTLNIIQIKLDASFIQDFFMMVFFTTIGLASFKLFKIGGKVLILYFVCCAFLAICQNFIGISLAKVLHIKPLLGLTAGSMSMEGGHGNAAAYGKTLEESFNIDSAITAALAAATLGLVFGGLVGGPLVKALIKRYNLKPENSDDSFKDYSKVESNEVLHRKYQPTQVFLSN